MSLGYMIPGLVLMGAIFGLVGIASLAIDLYFNGFTLIAALNGVISVFMIGVSLFMLGWAHLIATNSRYSWTGEL